MVFDKLILNNEIVKCRGLVKKAKVAIISKKIKRIKILRAWKKEAEKNKMLRKAERLLEEVMIIKKIREDDVTRFALQNDDLASIARKTPTNIPQHAYATLALEKVVQKQIAAIKKSTTETDLKELLKTLGTQYLLKKYKKINKETDKVLKKKNMEEYHAKIALAKEKRKNVEQSQASSGPNKDLEDDKTTQLIEKRTIQMDDANNPQKSKRRKSTRSSVSSDPGESDDEQVPKPTAKKPKNIDHPVEVEKVDDPFFVSKKVAIPKLILEEINEDPKKEVKFSKDDNVWNEQKPFKRDMGKRSFQKPENAGKSGEWKKDGKAFRDSKNPARNNTFDNPDVNPPTSREEKLHPSWAAKRQAQAVQPFKGTKIKFDLD